MTNNHPAAGLEFENVPKRSGDIAMVREALEISIGYISLVADGVGGMPILKSRAKADLEILQSAFDRIEAELTKTSQNVSRDNLSNAVEI